MEKTIESVATIPGAGTRTYDQRMAEAGEYGSRTQRELH